MPEILDFDNIPHDDIMLLDEIKEEVEKPEEKKKTFPMSKKEFLEYFNDRLYLFEKKEL